MAGQRDDEEGHTIQSHASLSVVFAPVEDSVSDKVISVSLEACRVRFASFFFLSSMLSQTREDRVSASLPCIVSVSVRCRS